MRRFVSAGIAACLVGMGVPSVAVRAQVSDVGYSAGSGDWALEQFGSDVAILRNRPAADEASILMSCAGSERRLRVSFPETSFASRSESLGAVVVTPVGSHGSQKALIATFRTVDPHTITLSPAGLPKQDIVAALGRMLLTRPKALDMLVSWGPGPVLFTRLMSYRLFLDLSDRTANWTGHFLTACQASSPLQAE